MRTEIIHEDPDILVVRKPPGLATQTSDVSQPDVVSELKNYLGARGRENCDRNTPGAGGDRSVYLGVIHRLDQPVEGLLVFARTKKAAAALSQQLNGREAGLNKHYYAVLSGYPQRNEGELTDYIYKDNTRRAVILNREEARHVPQAREAVLSFSVLEKKRVHPLPEMPEKEISLADIHIRTGRFHQIRAQMSHMGVPLLGDLRYGSQESIALSEMLGIRYVALCACSLEFCHPITGKKLFYTTVPEGKAFSFFASSKKFVP